ncbi:hypothetical protein [Agromyces bracchium]|uniref:Uncharacterized protein n=1 Tax=Agromyces bracchium TaxID=88376 RepID=A0A6I3M4W8_9MICO|nr:hypothetical protein [Agromyces bracchium]MTH67858.1 hypothetical protein [Agromyces bracchium]
MGATARADDRSPREVAQEQALGEVSDVLLNVEHSLSRAKKALAQVKKTGGNPNVELALGEAIADLTRVHKRLMQDTYYAGDSLRLI